MAFKGEIPVGTLNTMFKTGFTVNDIYRVQGSGNLVPNNLPVANGAFVKWTANGWEVQSDMQYAVSESGESLDQAVADVLDDHDSDDLTIFDVSKEFYDEHELGYYYALGDKIYLCTEHTRSGEEGAYTYSTKLTKQNGVVPVLNQLVDANKMQVIAAALNDLDARLKAVEESISSVNIGSRVADELDAQSLKVGGEDINTVIQNAIGG